MTQKFDASPGSSPAQDGAIRLLSLTMFLVPAVGVPNDLLIQDSVKSAILALGVLGATLVFFWLRRKSTEPLIWHRLLWAPVALLLYALGSMVWSHTYLASVEAIRWFVLLAFMGVALNAVTWSNLRLIAWGVHAGTALASLWVVLQYWFGFSLFSQGPQPAATFFNRNFFAEYAVCVLPLSVGLLAMFRPSRWLVPLAASVALIVLAILMTGTRSALASLWIYVPVLALVLVRYQKAFAWSQWSQAQRASVFVVLAIGIGGLGFIPSGNPQIRSERGDASVWMHSVHRANSVTNPSEYSQGSISVRATMWKATARMMMAHPWTGVGAGAWEVEIPLYQRADTLLETDYYAHNEFLQLLSEYGLLLGGAVLAFALAYLLKAAASTWTMHHTHVRLGAVRALVLTSLLGMLVVSNAGFPWHLAGGGALLALALALMFWSDAQMAGPMPGYTIPLPWKPTHARWAIACAACSLAIAGYASVRAFQAERKILQALDLAARYEKMPATTSPEAQAVHAQLLQDIREGIAIAPHYRKLTAMVAEVLTVKDDWRNAAWILESVAASRPHVAAVRAGLALAYARLGELDLAWQQLRHLQQLRPDAPLTRNIELVLLSNSGQAARAAEKMRGYFQSGQYDHEMVEAGYALGIKSGDWALAIESLELRNRTWPEQAADGYFRMGSIYAGPAVHNPTQALQAFRAGLALVPESEKPGYRSQVPEPFRSRM